MASFLSIQSPEAAPSLRRERRRLSSRWCMKDPLSSLPQCSVHSQRWQFGLSGLQYLAPYATLELTAVWPRGPHLRSVYVPYRLLCCCSCTFRDLTFIAEDLSRPVSPTPPSSQSSSEAVLWDDALNIDDSDVLAPVSELRHMNATAVGVALTVQARTSR